jgi:hypothetical protein
MPAHPVARSAGGRGPRLHWASRNARTGRVGVAGQARGLLLWTATRARPGCETGTAGQECMDQALRAGVLWLSPHSFATNQPGLMGAAVPTPLNRRSAEDSRRTRTATRRHGQRNNNQAGTCACRAGLSLLSKRHVDRPPFGAPPRGMPAAVDPGSRVLPPVQEHGKPCIRPETLRPGFSRPP